MSPADSPLPDRPMRFGDMLGITFRFMRRRPAATLGLGALLATATSTVSGIAVNGMVMGTPQGNAIADLFSGQAMTTQKVDASMAALRDAIPYLTTAAAVAIVVQFLAMGVMSLGMVRELRGESVRPSDLWGAVPWRRVVTINAIVLLVLLAVAGVPALLGLASGSTGMLVTAVGFAAGIAMMVSVVSALAVPASLLEDLPAMAALRRALMVARTGLLRATGIVVGSLILWDGVAGFVATPIAAIAGGLAGGASTGTGTALQTLVSGIVSGAVTLPATASMSVLLYVDLVRRSSRQ